jgi:peptidoglycan hydrolase-like protein with peptidoglycan-binding domain
MENILNRVKLLMNYDSSLTLTENIVKTEKSLISEVNTVPFFNLIKTALSTDKALFNILKKDLSIFKKFNNSDELMKELNIIQNGGESAILKPGDFDNLVKELSKNKAVSVQLQGTLTKSKKFDEIVQLVYPNGPNGGVNQKAMDKAKETFAKYGMTPQEVESMFKTKVNPKLTQGSLPSVISKEIMASDNSIKNLMKNPPSPKAAADDFVQYVIVDAGKAKLPVSKFQNIGRNLGYYGAKGFDKLKALRQKMSLKKAILYGLAGYGTYEYLNSLFSDGKGISVLPPCVVNTEKIELAATSSGDVVGVLKTTGVEEYDKLGGLKFYSNNRVWMGDNSKSGKYSCKSNTEIKTESIIKRKINEQSVGDIQITWDTAKTGKDDSGLGGVGGGNKNQGATWKESPSCDDVFKGTATINKGMKGECVTKIQTQLKTKGFDEVGNPDGKFGGKTQSAVMRLQRNGGLNQTGVVDAGTYKYLFFDNASTPEIETLKSKEVTNIPTGPTQEPTLNTPKVDDGTTLPQGAEGPINQPDYKPETQTTTEPERKRRGLRNLFGRNRR